MNPVNKVCVRNVLNDQRESDKAPIETFRNDLFNTTLLPMLESRDLVALSLTSKTMCLKTGPVLWARRKEEITIGFDQWKSVGFDVKETLQLPGNIDQILQSKCPYFEGKRVYQTHKLIFIPRGLSISKQLQILKGLWGLGVIWTPRVITGYYEDSEAEVTEPYWALITNKVIPESCDKSFEEQKELIKRGYEVPSALDAIALITTDEESLEKKKSCFFTSGSTRCKEGYEYIQTVVGDYHPRSEYELRSHCRSYIGVLALRKL